ncbi:hypothetical protein [Neobacillus terrae]|uniref:hypothetical protein n=1 Tax=Neobacillus terrae TaxID=3034837 RepID=UPI001408B8C0|nr:hypothetical protein [Neobacillus terrae]NHM33287.1 hypothetical protein [Neobacillus terrae]
MNGKSEKFVELNFEELDNYSGAGWISNTWAKIQKWTHSDAYACTAYNYGSFGNLVSNHGCGDQSIYLQQSKKYCKK